MLNPKKYPSLAHITILDVLQNLQFLFKDESYSYHLRFKAKCDRQKPHIVAWLDINNMNVKPPNINGFIYVKVLRRKIVDQ